MAYRLKLLLLCFVVVFISGCSVLKQLEDAGVAGRPTMALAAIDITAISVDDVTLDVVLDIDNPNPVGLNLAGVDYRLLVNGQQLIAGNKNDPLVLSAVKKTRITVPVNVRFRDIEKLGKSLLDSDNLDYSIETEARIDLPVLGINRFKADKQGSFPLPKIPSFELDSFEVKSVGLGGADIMVNIALENPNNFALKIKSLDYVLDVNGSRWVDGVLPRAVDIPAKSASKVQVPVSLNLLALGSQFMGSLQSTAPLDYQLKGQVKFDTSLPLLKNLSLPFDQSGKVLGQ